jgi:hypothetical protein
VLYLVAGGINASAQDMATWMNVIASGGKLPDGSRLVSGRTFRELTMPVTIMPIGGQLRWSGSVVGTAPCARRI